jgi:hypothetical protein
MLIPRGEQGVKMGSGFVRASWPQVTFSSSDGEEVFLCLPDVEKVFRLRSRIVQMLYVPENVRLASSLAAALPRSLFEHPQCEISTGTE